MITGDIADGMPSKVYSSNLRGNCCVLGNLPSLTGTCCIRKRLVIFWNVLAILGNFASDYSRAWGPGLATHPVPE